MAVLLRNQVEYFNRTSKRTLTLTGEQGFWPSLNAH